MLIIKEAFPFLWYNKEEEETQKFYSKLSFGIAGIYGYISPWMVKKREISGETLKKIVETHNEKCRFISRMMILDDPVLLKMYAKKITAVEFKLQELWGFVQNADFHEWFGVPKCKCPKQDNFERKGSPIKIISGNCPIHGE